MLRYPVRFTPTDGGVQLSFPDVPEAQVNAATEEEAIAGALEALERSLSGYVVDARPIPGPSDICGAPTVQTERFSLTGLET